MREKSIPVRRNMGSDFIYFISDNDVIYHAAIVINQSSAIVLSKHGTLILQALTSLTDDDSRMLCDSVKQHPMRGNGYASLSSESVVVKYAVEAILSYTIIILSITGLKIIYLCR